MTRTVWPGASEASETPGRAGVESGAVMLEAGVMSGAKAAVIGYETSKTKTIFIFAADVGGISRPMGFLMGFNANVFAIHFLV
jgi:hypothetical protein